MSDVKVSADEVNQIARDIVRGVDVDAAKATHGALCDLLQNRCDLLQNRDVSSFDGIMSLLFTAILGVKQAATRDDGATLSKHDAERVLIAIMRGPEVEQSASRDLSEAVS